VLGYHGLAVEPKIDSVFEFWFRPPLVFRCELFDNGQQVQSKSGPPLELYTKVDCFGIYVQHIIITVS
jgi:hypothetical protein